MHRIILHKSAVKFYNNADAILKDRQNFGISGSGLKLEICGGCQGHRIWISPRIKYGAGFSGTG
jgi:hypothetical protein